MTGLADSPLPPHVTVAKIIESCLPEASVEYFGEPIQATIHFQIHSQEVLILDSNGWNYGKCSKGGRWDDFLEGSYETIADHLLEPLRQTGLEVLTIPRASKFK